MKNKDLTILIGMPGWVGIRDCRKMLRDRLKELGIKAYVGGDLFFIKFTNQQDLNLFLLSDSVSKDDSFHTEIYNGYKVYQWVRR